MNLPFDFDKENLSPTTHKLLSSNNNETNQQFDSIKQRREAKIQRKDPTVAEPSVI